jgi:16S rRNA (adenine1518-N6/adenine1519-N6)-dimethyltransferase
MEDARSLLRRYGLVARKSLGQNFLVDPTAPERIVNCAGLTPEDTALEIGAGLGILTYELSLRTRQVFAIETDPALVAVLNNELSTQQNIKIITGNILEINPTLLLDLVGIAQSSVPLWGSICHRYVVVANLPYYITAAVIRHILESTVRPRTMVVTVQREVALRMVAQPDDMSLLSVSTQFYGKPHIMLRLKRGAFYPAPNVESAVIRLDMYENPPIPVDDIPGFFKVVRAGFSQKRKQLRNSLSTGLSLPPSIIETSLERCSMDWQRRAETLSLPEWSMVYRSLLPNLMLSDT